MLTDGPLMMMDRWAKANSVRGRGGLLGAVKRTGAGQTSVQESRLPADAAAQGSQQGAMSLTDCCCGPSAQFPLRSGKSDEMNAFSYFYHRSTVDEFVHLAFTAAAALQLCMKRK